MFIQLLSDVNAVSPDVWGALKENLLIVGGGLAGVFGTVKLTFSSIKAGFETLKKGSQSATDKQTAMQSLYAEKKELAEEKFRLESKLLQLESRDTNLLLQLEVAEQPATREKIKAQIQENDAKIAVTKEDLIKVDKELDSYKAYIKEKAAPLINMLSGSE